MTFVLTAGVSFKTEAQDEFYTIDPSVWSATDDLGRTLSSYGDLQKEDTGERFVGMFFWNWHEEFAKSTMPVNLTDLMGQAPEAKNDYHHPIWQGQNGYFFWNEPIYGYYSSE